MFPFRLAAALAASATVAGCLSQSHVIPSNDLMVLSQTAPEQRGQSVRVIQAFESSDDPPGAPRVDSGGGGVFIYSESYAGGGGGRPAPPAHRSAKNEADKAWVWIVLAVAAGVGLAATEGSRYDGWVRLDPMHPVHLYGWDGSYRWLPLAQIDPQTAAATRKAIVRPGEGPWTPLGRAPLDRQGWTYSILLGGAEMPSDYGDDAAGFQGHIEIGHFPTPMVGVLVDFGMGWRGNQAGDTLFDSRTAIELQIFPVRAGKVHLGGFGELGWGARLEDGVANDLHRGMLYGGGGLLQLELTTRLAITGRFAVTALDDETTSADFLAGISVY